MRAGLARRKTHFKLCQRLVELRPASRDDCDVRTAIGELAGEGETQPF